MQEGLTKKEAHARFYLVDDKGLLTSDRDSLVGLLSIFLSKFLFCVR